MIIRLDMNKAKTMHLSPVFLNLDFCFGKKRKSNPFKKAAIKALKFAGFEFKVLMIKFKKPGFEFKT